MNWPWIILWFIVGLVTFQIRGLKGYFKDFGILILIFSLPKLGVVDITSEVLTSVTSSVAYLFGANISRWKQFGTLSPKIIVYIILIVILATLFG